jgi:hypothetical protein
LGVEGTTTQPEVRTSGTSLDDESTLKARHVRNTYPPPSQMVPNKKHIQSSNPELQQLEAQLIHVLTVVGIC